MASIEQLPLAFKCPKCGKVVRTTRGILLKVPLRCPQCQGEVPREHMEWYARKSMLDYGKTLSDLEEGAA